MQFALKVLSPNQEINTLLLDAANPDEAAMLAKQQGHIVLSTKRGTAMKVSGLRQRNAGFPLVLFSQELLSLLDAGLSLMESIETLQEKEHRPQARRVLNQVMATLYEGLPFSIALEQAKVFPSLFIALVRSSERTGGLAESLTRFVDYQSQADSVRKRVISASIYPALLVIVGGMVTLFLLLYVVPKFSAIYENTQENLPLLSQWLLAWGRLLHSHATEVFSMVLGFIILVVYGFTRPAVHRFVVSRLWQIPAVGERLRIYQLARFYRTLGMLLRGGIPVIAAFKMVDGLLHPALRLSLQLADQDVREGLAISRAMEARGLTTPVAVRMLRVGERSGKMGEMMERIGSFYDDEIARWIDWFTRLFEPLLMTGIGIIVGVIVILMYMPVFELAGSIQ